MPERGKHYWHPPRGYRMTPEKWSVVRILARAHVDALAAAGPLKPLMIESIERSAVDVADGYLIPQDVFWDAVHKAS